MLDLPVRPNGFLSRHEFLEYLFHSHLADLKDIDPGIEGKILCPLCLRQFGIEGLESGNLSDGHVWPMYIRKKSSSEEAAKQRVLLCSQCNWTAGSRGDKQMQVLEQVREGQSTGNLFGERLVQVLRSPGEQPIKLRARIRVKSKDEVEGIKGDITFAVDKATRRFSRTGPEDQERFLSLARHDEKFTMMIHPYHELNLHLARVGWVTASYLLAFYTFGYRYILHESLMPVREYILKSFQSHGGEELEPPRSDVLSVQTCDEHYLENPEIAVIVPIDGQPVHLQVSFLDYHVKLPFHGVPQLLEYMIRTRMPDIEDMIPEMPGEGAHLYIPVHCTKLDGHDCRWDYILGKPLPQP